MHFALLEQAHRPWLLPRGAWRWRQSWCDLLFAHWPVESEVLRRLVPAELELDECDGTAWIGLVPFRMAGVAPRPLPDVPGLSAFPEVNVRTYVRSGSKPGVWFFSLDATNPVAVWAARKFFHLPYFRASMALELRGERVEFRSDRAGAEGVGLRVGYGPTSEPRLAAPGSLEYFLTERYCLYAQAPDGSVWRTEVHHRPWPLQDAQVDLARESLLASAGVPVEGPPTLVHFSRGVDVVSWNPEQVVPPRGTLS